VNRLPTSARPALALLLAWTGFLPICAHAQSRPLDKAIEQHRSAVPGSPAPLPPRDSGAADDAPPEEDPPDATPFGVDLAALRLIAHQDHADPGLGAGAARIEVAPEIEPPARLEELLETYLGQPLSMALLAELAKDIVEAWRDNDFPIVDVYYPEQNVTAGRVQVVVREALLGSVGVEGAERSDPEYLKGTVRLGAGDRLDRRVLEADLDWLNENPIRQVNLIYERGEADGTSDIVLQTLEENPFRAYAGFANTGVPLTGEHEWAAGFQWYNPLGKEHTLGYHFVSDLEFETLTSHAIFYRAFLPWRHELRYVGAVVQTEVRDRSGGPFPIDLEGESIQSTLDYRIPLPRPSAHRRLRHAVTAGFDYKSTNTDLLFGGFNVFGSPAEVLQLRLEYEAAWPDALGRTELAFGSVWSPGDVFANNRDANFDLLREGATSDYWYGFVRAERSLRLPSDYLLVMRGRAHLTDDRLISTEQLLAGGYLTVRGFEENLARGDTGAILGLELLSPAFSLSRHLGETPALAGDRWQLLAFYDAGLLSNNDPRGSERSVSLQSLGLGVQARLSENAQLRAAYGWALDSRGVAIDVPSGRMHFGITLSY